MRRATRSVPLVAETLAGIDVFRNLSPQQRQAVAKYCRAARYQPGQAIVSYNDSSQDVYFIVSGSAQAIIYSMSGKQATLQDLGSGTMFGEISAIDGEPRSAHVIAATESLVASISGRDFLTILREYPGIAEATMQRLVAMVRLLAERVFEISTLPVRQRIHAELLRLALTNANPDDTAVIYPVPTHTDIANHIGSHREAVSREFAKLTARGLLKRDKQGLIINNLSQLAQLVHDDLQD